MRIKKPLVRWAKSFVPDDVKRILRGDKDKGRFLEGTISARYCYTVWMRHLVCLHEHQQSPQTGTIAEFGPGNSVGVGIAALLSGFERYYAFDIEDFTNTEKNLAVFDEIVALFQERTPIPDDAEFPEVWPQIESYAFPHHILDDALLDAMIQPERLDKMKHDIGHSLETQSGGEMISYYAPWDSDAYLQEESVDFILSQAVLEHVEDPRYVYGVMHKWLKPGAIMSHSIDYRSHNTAQEWNGHWAYSDMLWSMMYRNRRTGLNRCTHSQHLALIEETGFRVLVESSRYRPSEIKRSELAKRFEGMSDEDMNTAVGFVMARK